MSIGERISREVKNELGRFFNWPPLQNVQLGTIGYWEGKEAAFVPQSSLDERGIRVGLSNQLDLKCDELYSTSGSVSLEFKLDVALARSRAEMSFRTKHALSSQCYQTSFEQLDLVGLLGEIRRKYKVNLRPSRDYVGTGNETWDPDWLIVTSIWVPLNYTLIVSGANDARASLAANTSQNSFNIADAGIGVTAESLHNTAYQLVAGSGARPFFEAHKVVVQAGKVALKRYGSPRNKGLLI